MYVVLKSDICAIGYVKSAGSHGFNRRIEATQLPGQAHLPARLTIRSAVPVPLCAPCGE
jgi:hypothetical protein